ncbi:MAG TPA: DUF3048 domain-containing protein [Patescibacteria group bacterium]
MDDKDKKEAERIEELKNMIDKGTSEKTETEEAEEEPYNTPPKSEKDAKRASKEAKPSAMEDPEKRKKMIIVGSTVLLALLVATAVIAAVLSRPAEDNDVTTPISVATSSEPKATATPVPVTQASNLDGVVVANELATRHPLAIMIENSTLARPQTGLTDASVVYEAIVEGGITRFMAVYGHTLPAKAGPVRSARPVFLDFASEYTPRTAYYAHVGGSPEAIDRIKKENVYDLDQGGIGTKAFQRFPKAGLATEHTMYTFPEKLLEIAKSRNYSTDATFKSWKFKNDAQIADRPESQSITIPFSSASYEVKYIYDKTSNTYKRYMAGVEHKDAVSGKQIAPKNIIIHFANYATTDVKGRQDVDVVGTGTAKIFRDGKVIEATWSKSAPSARSIYTDTATGQEVELNAGQIFVEVPKTGSVITVQ